MGHTRNLLIIDDSPEDRELYRRYLLRDHEYSYNILEASRGQQGLELWRQHHPDIVLLDYRLPDMDGLGFLDILRSLAPQQYLPVIVVTGQGSEAIAVKAMKAGAQDYLIKEQITPEGLRIAVDGAITKVQLHSQLQQCIERERLVAQIGQRIHQSLNLDEILQTTVTEVREFLQVDRVLIFRLQVDGSSKVITESVGTDWTPLLLTSYHDPCFRKAYAESFLQGCVISNPDIQDSSIAPCHLELLAKLQVRANLVVPIMQNGQLWGTLIAHHCAAPRQWQPSEVDLLKELATQVGVALQQAELYQQAQNELAERKRVEAELRESGEHLKLALDASRMGTWDWNIQTGKISWSDNLEALFGLQAGEFDGSFEMFAVRLHPEDYDRVLAAVDRAVTTGADYDIEFRIVYPNGTIRWALSQGKVFYDPIGQPLRMAGIDLDVTERKRSEQAIQESDKLLRLALKGAQAGLWDWDIQANKVVWSPENFDLYGLTPVDGLPRYEDWENALYPEDREWANAEVARVIEQRLPEFRAEFRIIHPQKGMRWLLGLGCLTLNKQGEPIRLSGINLDITAQKQAEIERDRLLKQEQAARAEAERANRIKDEFLAVLSHELRSPLTPILGWVQLLQTRNFSPATKAEALATIERNTKLQTQLIDDLLDIAKVLHGKLSLDTAPVNLAFVIEAAINTMSSAAVAKSIVLQPVLSPVVQVLGDATRLQQIFWNLLSNAIKFTPRKGRVDITLERIDNQSQITVSDTGKGIAPDFLPYIFELFHQEDASTTRKYGGLGLGLAIVRQLVEAHGGTIAADSLGEGLGATFIVRLPLLESGLEIEQTEEVSEQEFDLTGIRILTVDDEPDTRYLLTVLLTQYGAEVIAVTSAAEVLASLDSFQPDALVSDIGMPEVDGYTLIQQIRSLPPERGGQTPAIALTAYAREDDYQRAIASGFQRYMTKPLQPEQLVQAVLELASNNKVSIP